MDTSSLMEQILSNENLNRAYLQVVRNKGAEGVDGMKYTELKEHLAKNGEIIKEQLRTRKYKPQPVRRVVIPKTDGGVRNLGVSTVTDRFIQQAIAQVLTPIYEEQFHDHSYGFRPNRCAQQAVLTALDMMNDGNDWIVDIDLEKFFDTVNHDKLMTIIGRTIKDGDVISIIRKYLVSGIMIDDEYEDSIVGTPQGGNLSPLLANIMLNELDKEMEKRGLNFVRYADDCIIMVGSEMSANRVMRNISRFIGEKLRLKVNMTKSKVDKPQGLKYLGFGFYFDSRAHQFKAKPHAKSVAKFTKKMKELTCRSWGVSNSYKIEKLGRFIDDDKSYISPEHYERLKKYTCKSGEIIIGTLGEPNLRACIVPEVVGVAINKADCVHYIPKSEILNNDFVCQYINCPETLLLAKGMIHGQTRSRVSSGQIAQMPIFVPPIDLQRDFSEFMSQTDKSKVVDIKAA